MFDIISKCVLKFKVVQKSKSIYNNKVEYENGEVTLSKGFNPIYLFLWVFWPFFNFKIQKKSPTNLNNIKDNHI